MLGTIIYTMLDVGLSMTLWTTKIISSGVIYGYHYFLGSEEHKIQLDPTPNTLLLQQCLDKIDRQQESIDSLHKDFIGLQKLT